MPFIPEEVKRISGISRKKIPAFARMKKQPNITTIKPSN